LKKKWRERSAQFTVIVPARYASTRFPGKRSPTSPASDGGARLRASEAKRRRAVHVATDDRHRRCRAQSRHSVVMTSSDHASARRLAEAAQLLDSPMGRSSVNVQGDEPLIAPALIARWRSYGCTSRSLHGTACHAIHVARTAASPNVVRWVLDAQGYASTSRAPRFHFRGSVAK